MTRNRVDTDEEYIKGVFGIIGLESDGPGSDGHGLMFGQTPVHFSLNDIADLRICIEETHSASWCKYRGGSRRQARASDIRCTGILEI